MTNSDKSYKLLNSVIESLENKYGYISNVQTLKEGRVNFKYEVMFCKVYLGSEYVKMLKK